MCDKARSDLAVAVGVALVFAAHGQAGVIVGYNPSDPNSHLTYDRFVSGYPSTTGNPTVPVSNTSPQFIGNGYSNNLSGVGWMDSNPTFSVTMVSQREFIGAAHVGYAAGSQIDFVNAAGQVYTATVQMTRSPTTTFTDSNGVMHTVPSDVILGTLTAPIPASAGISFYPIIKAPITIEPLVAVPGGQTGQSSPPSFYSNQPMLNYGQNPSYSASTHLGKNAISDVQVVTFGNYSSEATVGAFYTYNSSIPGDFYLISGDSGGPSFIPYNGQLTLLGGHYGVSDATTTPVDGDISVDTFLPYYTDQLNAFMAQDTDATHPNGYSLTLITPVPEPGTSALVGFAATVFGGRMIRSRRVRKTP